MAKARFEYGVVGSRKTAEAMLLIHKMKEAGKNVLVIQPSINTRDGDELRSRAIKNGYPAIKTNNINILEVSKNYDIIVIDEIQFLEEKNREELKRLIQEDNNKLIFCYGLLSDFRGRLFEAIIDLLPFFQKIREVDSICVECGKEKATMNAMIGEHEAVNGISVGNHFKGVCIKCWSKMSKKEV